MISISGKIWICFSRFTHIDIWPLLFSRPLLPLFVSKKLSFFQHIYADNMYSIGNKPNLMGEPCQTIIQQIDWIIYCKRPLMRDALCSIIPGFTRIYYFVSCYSIRNLRRLCHMISHKLQASLCEYSAYYCVLTVQLNAFLGFLYSTMNLQLILSSSFLFVL